MCLYKARRKNGESLLQFLQRQLTLSHSAFEEGKKRRRVGIAPTVKGLSHRFESLRDRVQIFRAVESSFFEVIKKTLKEKKESQKWL